MLSLGAFAGESNPAQSRAAMTSSHRNAAAPPAWTIRLLVGLLCLIWGSTWIVIKDGLADIPPFTSAATRFAIATVAMFAVAPALSRREGGSAPPLALSVTVGTLNFAASYSIVYWSQTVLPSGLTSVLWSIYPMMQAFLGHHFLPAERIARGQAVGFVLGFLGVALLFLTDLRQLGPGAIPAAGILVLSPLVSAVGNTAAKLRGAGHSSALLNRNALLVGTAWLALLALGTERDQSVVWTRAALVGTTYLALVGTVVTFTLFFWLLRYEAAHRLSVIAYVTPGLALTLGWLFADEHVGPTTIAGAIAILAGVALVTRRRRAQ